MYERILVPLDGSKTAEIVIPYVEEIAAKLGREIILVSISESKTGAAKDFYNSYLPSVTEQLKSQLKGWGAKQDVEVQGKVLPGRPAHEILRFSDEVNADLIIMTSRGLSGSAPIGSVAARVLRATSRPTLLIRTPASDTDLRDKRLIKRILVPLDGSKIGESAIPYADMLASTFSAELVLLYVLESRIRVGGEAGPYPYIVSPNEDSLKVSAIVYLHSVAQPLKLKGLKVSSEAIWGAPADKIIDYAKTNAVDVIAMSTHGRSGIGRWVFGSVTDKVLHAGDTPVLVVRAAKTRGITERAEEEIKKTEVTGWQVTKAYFLFTGSGPLVILTSYDSILSPDLLKKLHSKGMTKFMACEVPVELAKERYGTHFNVVCEDLHETDDLRVLDYNGERAYRNFSFKELGTPIYHEFAQTV